MYAVSQGYASANITDEQKRTWYATAFLPGGKLLVKCEGWSCVNAPVVCLLAVKRQTLSSCDGWLLGTSIDSWLVLWKIHASQINHPKFPPHA